MPTLLFRLVGMGTVLAACEASTPAFAADGGRTVPISQPREGDWTFSLLPKAFQRTPDLEMTVNTEVTPYGRLLRTPTTANPMYYLPHDTGYKQMGDHVGGDKPPPQPQIEQAMARALAVNGYEPTTPDHPPTLVVFYFWGSHYRLDRDTEANFPVLAAQHRMERAMLVGGHAQMEKMARAMEFGESLTDRTAQYEYLRDQALDDLYYVVASAYDYAALARHDRKLVWRTTMTVNARGVSMQETMTPLIATAGPYFGRDMSEPEIAMRRISRWGVVIGESKVIEDDVPLPRSGTSAPPSNSEPKPPVKR